MQTNRLYLIDTSDPDLPAQTEVGRSAPNELQPTTEWEVPVEYLVTRVRVVQGYGNIDTFIYATRDPEMAVDLPLEAIQGKMTQVPDQPKVANVRAKVQSL
jgi:hypothetical protein